MTVYVFFAFVLPAPPDYSGIIPYTLPADGHELGSAVQDERDQERARIIRPIPVHFYPAMFRGDSGMTRIEIALGIPHRFLDFQKSMFGKGKCPLNIVIGIAGPEKTPVTSTERQIVIWSNTLPPDRRGYFLSRETISVKPGKAILSLQASTLDKGRFGRRETVVDVPFFGGDSLVMSSIQPAYRIDDPALPSNSGSSSALEVTPYPFNAFIRSYPVYAYFQIYNLRPGQSGGKQYRIEYTIHEIRESVSLFSRLAGQGKQKLVYEDRLVRNSGKTHIEDYISFDPEKFAAGNYLLSVSITDDVSKSSTAAVMPFEIIDEPSQLLP